MIFIDKIIVDVFILILLMEKILVDNKKIWLFLIDLKLKSKKQN
jgi:hypothetical protein